VMRSAVRGARCVVGGGLLALAACRTSAPARSAAVETPIPATSAGPRTADRAPPGSRLTSIAIPMRDGVLLRGYLLLPHGNGPFPVIVYRTPYGVRPSVEASALFRKAVARGYAIVAQDVRGRYESDGEYLPYQQEGRDGYDTIEWAARQPWSNGSVGMVGGSYSGAVQWFAALESPPHLKAIIPDRKSVV
jgi:predicted acyl esterase